MQIFPSITLFRGQEAFFQNGSLVNLPAELMTAHCISMYKRIASIGWGRSELGYHYYAFDVHDYARIIFVGLFLSDMPAPLKKFNGYKAIFSRNDVEKIASQINSFQIRYKNSIRDSIGSLIHDIRSFSRDIYHVAKEGEQLLEVGNSREAKVRFVNIWALQQMLKMRVDAFDYVDDDFQPDKFVSKKIYPIVDKVCRAFKPRAAERSIGITLNGRSEGTSVAPDYLILVPYVIIENSIKYAPKESRVDIFVYETDSEIITTIESFGPRLSKADAEHIFERGFRGANAKQRSIQGSGIGLFLAEKIVKSINGKIEFEQEPSDSSDYIGFCRTFVRFYLKKSGGKLQ